MNRMDISHNLDLYKSMDAKKNLMKVMMEGPVQIDRLSLTLGYPGVYSSFLLFAELSGKGYGVDARGIHKREAERMIR